MLFDWFTFAAQLVNFLILVWLLKRYLFKPILEAIDQRERKIAKQLHEAEESKANTSREFEHYQQKNREFDQQRSDLLSKAIIEINDERVKLLDQTRVEVESLRLRLQESLRNEQLNMGSEIIQRTRSEVFSVVRKTLDDLASANLEEQITTVFVKQINNLKSDERELFLSVLQHPDREIIIRSVFDLPINLQNAIKNAIRSNFNILVEIKFETAPQFIAGIELFTHGFKVSWNIEEYLISLEANITDLLNQRSELINEKAS